MLSICAPFFVAIYIRLYVAIYKVQPLACRLSDLFLGTQISLIITDIYDTTHVGNLTTF